MKLNGFLFMLNYDQIMQIPNFIGLVYIKILVELSTWPHGAPLFLFFFLYVEKSS